MYVFICTYVHIYAYTHTHTHKHTNTHVRTCNEEGREKRPASAAVHHRHLGYVYICIHTHTLTHTSSHTYTHTYAPPTRKGRRSAQPTQLCIMATFISLGCCSSSYAHIFDVMSGVLSKDTYTCEKRPTKETNTCERRPKKTDARDM